ncbi:MAG: hypothetical protein ABEL97_01895 [Salinibacter sp.]
MLRDDLVDKLRAAVADCETAREALQSALEDAEEAPDADDAQLQAIATALEDWRDAEQRFMNAVETSEADDVSTAAMLLKMNHGIDATEARRGLPGMAVEGATQPFDLDTTGTRGTLLTTAAMEYVSS